MRVVLATGSFALALGLVTAAPAFAECDPNLISIGCSDPTPPPPSPAPGVPLLSPPTTEPQPDPAPPHPQPQPDPQPEASPPAPAPATDMNEADGARTLADLINRDRSAERLPPLRVVVDLDEVATRHSRDMAAAGSIWHNDDLFRPATKQRLQARTIGENVAQNPTIADAHRRLMASPGHRANVLSPTFATLGIGLARAGNSWFVTEVFVQPRATAATGSAPAAGARRAVDPTTRPATATATAPTVDVTPPSGADTTPTTGAGTTTGPPATPEGTARPRSSPVPSLPLAIATALLMGVTAQLGRTGFSLRAIRPIVHLFVRKGQEHAWNASCSSTTRIPSVR